MSSRDEQPDARHQDKLVGYARPPECTRFKKGQSGNPKGRPKGTQNVATVLRKTLREKVMVNENGKRKVITKLEAAIKQLVNKAASGELRALRQLIELARDAEVKENIREIQKSGIGELDQDVIEGILKRFQSGTEGTQKKETNDYDH